MLRIFDSKRLFCLDLYFTLAKWVFFGLFSLPQNLKMAIYKAFRVSRRSKKAKKNVVIADYSKIEARLKALSVRF